MHIALAAKGLVAAGAVIGGAVAGFEHSVASHSATPAAPSAVNSYTVQPGDTLARISLRYCGSATRYPALAAASGVSNPNLIRVGQHITLNCGTSTSNTSSTSTGNNSDREPDGDGDDVTTSPANIPGVSSGSHFSYTGLEILWESVGGSSAHAATAACIAEAESGGNAGATGPHGERGLWQIAPSWGALSTYNPGGNARAAVIISHNGTNWGPWTTRGRCGV